MSRPASRHQKESKKLDDARHLVLLAMNEVGYKNLLKLTSMASLEGMYYKPRIDRELLQAHNEGLICLSACLGAEVPHHLMNGDVKAAEYAACEFREIFGDRYYLELQDHMLDKQHAVNEQLIRNGRAAENPAGRHQRCALSGRTPMPTRIKCCCASRPARRWTTRRR